MRLLNTFIGSLFALIALLVVLDRAGGAARILGASGQFVRQTVGAFKP
jgi:hypothetical protein